MGNSKSTYVDSIKQDSQNIDSEVRIPSMVFRRRQKAALEALERYSKEGLGTITENAVVPGAGILSQQTINFTFDGDEETNSYRDQSETGQTVFNFGTGDDHLLAPGGTPGSIQFSGSFLGSSNYNVDLTKEHANFLKLILDVKKGGKLKIGDDDFAVNFQKASVASLGDGFKLEDSSGLSGFKFTQNLVEIYGTEMDFVPGDSMTKLYWPNVKDVSTTLKSSAGDSKNHDGGTLTMQSNRDFNFIPGTGNGSDYKNGDIELESDGDIVFKVPDGGKIIFESNTEDTIPFQWPTSPPLRIGARLRVTTKGTDANNPHILSFI